MCGNVSQKNHALNIYNYERQTWKVLAIFNIFNIFTLFDIVLLGLFFNFVKTFH